MKNIAFYFVLFLSLTAAGQQRGKNWFFGRNASLSFPNSAPVAGMGNQDAFEACASISDIAGNLLFYTDGVTVWNRNHLIMTNGSGIEGNRSATQGALIVPMPGSGSLYYLFTIDDTLNNVFSLKYSVIDMRLSGALGAVTVQKNQLLLTGISERMCATMNADYSGVWLVVRDAYDALFHAFEINNQGLSSRITSTAAGSITSSQIGVHVGQMKFSPNGEYLAWACRTDRFVEVLKFDRTNGTFQSWNRKITFNQGGEWPYGVEFSPDASRFYISLGSLGLVQLNMELIENELLFRNSVVKISTPSNSAFGLQLGPDKRIYIANFSNLLHVIANPNELGLNANFFANNIILNPSTFSRDGLPNFISNYFSDDIISISGTCFGAPTWFKSNSELADSILWIFGDIASGSLNFSRLINPEHTFSQAGNFLVKRIIYLNGNSDTAQRNIFIKPVPHVFLGSDTTVCLGSVVLLNPALSNATYLWNDGRTDPIYSVLNSGLYSVRVEQEGCYSSDSIFVTVLQPTIQLEFTAISPCELNNAFEFKVGGTDTLASIFWNFGDGTVGYSSSMSHQFPNAGMYDVELRASNSQGCLVIFKKKVEVFGSVKANFNVNSKLQCLGSNEFVLSFDGHQNPDLHQFYYQFSDGKLVSQTPFSHRFSSPGEQGVSLVTISKMGCKDSSYSKLMVLKNPKADFIFDSSNYCAGGPGIEFISTSSSENGPIEIQVFNSLGFEKSGPMAKFIYPNAGQHDISLVAIDSFGCASVATKAFTIYPLPTISFQFGTNSNCLGMEPIKARNYSSISSGSIEKYLWDFGDGSGSEEFEPIKLYETDGSYILHLVAISDKGCRSSEAQSVKAYAKPRAAFELIHFDSCIASNSISLRNISSISDNVKLSYVWDIDGTVKSSTDITDYQFQTAGSKSVQLKVISEKGCVDSVSASFQLYQNPKGLILIDEPEQCLNGNLFHAISLLPAQSGAITSLKWELANGKSYNSPEIDFIVNEIGEFQVKLHLHNEFGCYSKEQTSVFLNPNPIADFDVQDICLGASSSLINSSTLAAGYGSMHYNWSIGDENFSSDHSPQHLFNYPGIYTVKLKVLSDKGCPDQIAKTLEVKEIPAVDYTYRKKAYDAEKFTTIYQFEVENPDSQTTAQWYVDGILSASGNSVDIAFEDTGYRNIRLLVNKQNSCSNQIERQLYIGLPLEMYFPTAFTPNGDGKNDLFKPEGEFYIANYEMHIVNRWGSVVFHSNTITQGWDGTFSGRIVEPGVYSYIVNAKDLEGGDIRIAGSVLLVY